MGDTFNKKEKEKKKQQKKKDKEQRKAERKANAKPGQALEDMLAYVDENGNISATPPDKTRKIDIAVDDIVVGSRNTGHSAAEPHTGRVEVFNVSKGYGFIKDKASGNKIFFHVSSLNAPIKEGDRVSFDIGMGPKGPVAANIVVL